MKLAMSNIGWIRHDDPQVLHALHVAGVQGIEVAPTKVWPDWGNLTATRAGTYRAFLAECGFSVPAMQAILFGKPELQLFAVSAAAHERLVEHIRLVADVAQALEAKVLVFGAPKARRKGELSKEQAMLRAEDIFAELGEVCAARGTCLCIEPNPVEYGCDFVTTAADALELVEHVNHPGFGLHLDAAALFMSGELLGTLLPRLLPQIRHYHISEPYLSGFDDARVPHADWLSQLASANYPHWCSVEVDCEKHELARTLAFLRASAP